jgi:hypothetical protein
MKPRQVPAPRARAVLDMDPAELAAELSKLPPRDQYVVAARLGAEMSEARQERARELRDASKDVAGHKSWRGYADRRIPYDELQRRRAQPGPRIPGQRTAGHEARAEEAAQEEPAQWVAAPALDAGAARVRGR